MPKKTVYSPPCTGSNNPEFLEDGCPEQTFNRETGEGCPKWKEYKRKDPTKPDDEPALIRCGCVDILKEFWAFEQVRLLETQIGTTESFRDGMCEMDKDGKTYPKMDRATLGLIGMIQEERGMKNIDNVRFKALGKTN